MPSSWYGGWTVGLFAVLISHHPVRAQAMGSDGPATLMPPVVVEAQAAEGGAAGWLNPAGDAPTPSAGWPPVDAAPSGGAGDAAPLPAMRPAGAAPPPPPGVLGALPGAPGLGGMGLLVSPVVGRLPVLAGYRITEFFDAPVKDQNAHLGYTEQNVNVLTPIWQNNINEFSATAHIGVASFDTNAILPSTQQPFPADLWNVNLGTNYRHLFDNDWIAGGGVSIGSASDKPFHGLNEMTVTAQGFLRIPSGQTNSWLFTLALSSNSQVLPYIPIPGVAYLYAPSKTFQAVIGFPFASVTWRPADDWTINCSYALLTNFHGRVSYQLCRPVRLFAGIDFNTQNYFRTGRVDPNDRFYMYYDQLSTGVQVILGRHAFFDLSAGYVFDRFFFESKTFTSDPNFNRVNVGDGAFLSGTLQFRF